MSLPTGVVQHLTYDDASQITDIVFDRGEAVIGELHYAYDASGLRRAVWGTSARTGLPDAVGAASYDAGNRLVAKDGTGFTYDENGNLTARGSTAYTWDARNRLRSISGPSGPATFGYDSFGAVAPRRSAA